MRRPTLDVGFAAMRSTRRLHTGHVHRATPVHCSPAPARTVPSVAARPVPVLIINLIRYPP
ncbi:hypothetical protein C6P77_28255 [Burkholderia ambifaria]|nr:hypothetical protein C6P77_28255 [Burkholderia ambifaria]